MSSQQHTGTQEVCYWYLGARPSRGARARARARGPPHPVGVRQHEQSRKHFPYIYGYVQNLRRTRTTKPRTTHGRFSIQHKGWQCAVVVCSH